MYVQMDAYGVLQGSTRSENGWRKMPLRCRSQQLSTAHSCLNVSQELLDKVRHKLRQSTQLGKHFKIFQAWNHLSVFSRRPNRYTDTLDKAGLISEERQEDSTGCPAKVWGLTLLFYFLWLNPTNWGCRLCRAGLTNCAWTCDKMLPGVKAMSRSQTQTTDPTRIEEFWKDHSLASLAHWSKIDYNGLTTEQLIQSLQKRKQSNLHFTQRISVRKPAQRPHWSVLWVNFCPQLSPASADWEAVVLLISVLFKRLVWSGRDCAGRASVVLPAPSRKVGSRWIQYDPCSSSLWRWEKRPCPGPRYWKGLGGYGQILVVVHFRNSISQ